MTLKIERKDDKRLSVVSDKPLFSHGEAYAIVISERKVKKAVIYYEGDEE